MNTENLISAVLLTLFAGLSTGIGGLISFFSFRKNKKFLSVALGFSAGIMIYVSFVELFAGANAALVAELGQKLGSFAAVLAFFGGMLFIALIDKLVPEQENPHEIHYTKDIEDKSPGEKSDARLMKVGMVTALAIVIHNIPEGLATFASVIKDPQIGIVIAVAVAIHNIPEGIAVAVPIYYSTGNKARAFVISFLSGLAEFAGALLGLLLFMPFLNDVLFGVLFSFVAGIMVFISFDELLPTAREYGEHHLSIYGLIAGMGVMALSLILLQ